MVVMKVRHFIWSSFYLFYACTHYKTSVMVRKLIKEQVHMENISTKDSISEKSSVHHKLEHMCQVKGVLTEAMAFCI